MLLSSCSRSDAKSARMHTPRKMGRSMPSIIAATLSPSAKGWQVAEVQSDRVRSGAIDLAAQVPEAVGGRAHGQIRCRGGRGAQVAEVIYGCLIGLLVTWLMSNVWPVAWAAQNISQNVRLPLQK